MITKDSPCLVPLEKAYFFQVREITEQSFQPGSPSTGHTPPSRALAVTTYSKSLDSGAIFASQKYFPPHWFCLIGAGFMQFLAQECLFLLCQVSFSLATALFQWLRIQPTKLPFQLLLLAQRMSSSFQ